MAARMTPPRKPRGEKPATTIRFLRRQIANMQVEINGLRSTAGNDIRLIESLRAEISDHEQREEILTAELENSAEAHGNLLASTVSQRTRLAFLEGYYAKSTETIPGAGPGNPGAHPNGAANGEAPGREDASSRSRSPTGRKIFGLRPNYPAFDNRRPPTVDAIVTAARDATPSELERHRR